MKIKLYILLNVILLLLTACGSKHKEPVTTDATINYGVEFLDSGLTDCHFIAGCAGFTDGQVYLAVTRQDDEHFSQHYLYSVSKNSTPNLILAADDFLAGAEGFAYIENIQAGADDSIWVTLSVSPSSLYGNYLWHVDRNGVELDRIRLNPQELSIKQIDGVLVDDNNWLYIISGPSVVVLDREQHHQFTLDTKGNTVPRPVRLSNGQAGFLISLDDTSAEVRTIDREAQDWGETYTLPGGCKAIYPGSGEYLFFSTVDQTLGGWNVGKGSLIQLVRWLDIGINTSTLLGFSVDTDGQIMAAVSPNNSVQMAILTPDSESPEKTVLTLASTRDMYYLREYVSQFNQTNTTCRIEYKPYYTQTGDYFSLDEYQQGVTRLLTEIGAGRIPDLLCVDDLPVLRFGAIGMLEDLWPYIENDPELGREAVMEHVLECAQQDGKLYTIFDSFIINTVVGSRAVVGDRTNWTLNDLRAALATMPDGCAIFSPNSTKLETLKNIIYADLENYVDWERGACSFDSSGFREILSFCNEMETEEGAMFEWYTLVPEGREMLLEYALRNFIRIQEHQAIFGGEISYVGYPRSDGECGSSFEVMNPIVMTTACKNKEGAWSFLRQFLLPQELPTDTYGNVDVSNAIFPVNRESSETLLEASMKPAYSDDGEELPPTGIGLWDNKVPVFEVIFSPMPQTQCDQIMELYNAVSAIYTTDNALWEIISEQAQPYFAGDKSVDEAARLIQSRAELYVNERK